MGLLDMLKKGYQEKGITAEDARDADIQRKFSDLEMKKGELEKINKDGETKLTEFKKELLGKVFSQMRSLGVDPGDRESLRNFFKKLEESDPDLLRMLQFALESLDPDGTGPTVGLFDEPSAIEGQEGMIEPGMMQPAMPQPTNEGAMAALMQGPEVGPQPPGGEGFPAPTAPPIEPPPQV